MRHFLMAAAVSGTALFAGLSAANAQIAIETPAGGVYVGPTYYNDGYYYEPYGQRAYGYYGYDRGYHNRSTERYRDRQRCGRGAHWDGQRCVAGFRP